MLRIYWTIQTLMKFESKCNEFHSKKCPLGILQSRLQKGRYFVITLMCSLSSFTVFRIRYHFVYVPCQWETTLHCNIISHWLGAYTKWTLRMYVLNYSGSTFIKPDQPDPWIKDQIKIILLSTISPLQLPNFVSCGRDKPSHMTQNFVTVVAKLWTAERFLIDPWSMDQADLVW